jgi:two-component system, OmpR family, sensor kinase
MNLRQKLLTTFGGLGLLALVTAGMTVGATLKWQESEEKLQSHYQRSLLVQQVRAAVFRAVKEVPDAVTGGDEDARQEFDESLKTVDRDFQRWAELAHNNEERQQVEQVRKAYEALVQDARAVFDLVEAGRRNEALQLMEGELEGNFVPFQTLTEEAVASDQNNRQVIRAQTQRTRQTAQLVLAIASFGTVSLVLLLAAYLASDLFAPLREVRQALDDLAAGDLERRLDEERADELGAINRAFNHMAEAIQQREQVVQLAAVPAGVAEEGANGSAWQYMPSRLMLHRLVSQLRSRVTQLGSDNELDGDGAVVTQHKQELVSQLDRLLQVVSRLTEFGFPLDLNLARTDIRALLYEVLLRFHDDFARRAISFELDISPAIGYAIVDRLKLREALGELVRNALAAIPESGGRLGLRTSIAADGTQLLIEVADNGTGAEQPLINRAFSMREIGGNQRPGVGLKLTKAIVEQHGGHLDIDSRPGVGTYVQIKLPLRE